jgi:hypothetical protein
MTLKTEIVAEIENVYMFEKWVVEDVMFCSTVIQAPSFMEEIRHRYI